MSWPTLTEWGLIAVLLLVFFALLWFGYLFVVEVLARKDVREARKDRSR